jgi:hypothetical protein
MSTTSRFAVRATASLLAAMAAAGLASSAALAAEPTPVGVPGPIPTSAPAPAPAADQAQANSAHGWSWTKGTEVTFRNQSDTTVWLRHYDYAGRWNGAVKMAPGSTKVMTGTWVGTDDVEFRLFRSAEDANANRRGYEIDAENPAYSEPWMSVDYRSQYFKVGDQRTWVRSGGIGEFHGARKDDTKDNKVFELTMKTMY